MQPVSHTIHNNTFWLSPHRCVFWEEEKALVVSDLHFGKTGHFRKSGIAIPQNIFKEDIQRLVDQIAFFKPEQLIIAGDLFHSEANKELELFLKWRRDFSSVYIHLAKGNHDILEADWYTGANINVAPVSLTINRFCFMHDKEMIEISDDVMQPYFFTGHIHPGVRVSGAGKQSLSFPCFYFAEHHAVLPAFSRFTGIALMDRLAKDTVYAIVNRSLVKIK